MARHVFLSFVAEDLQNVNLFRGQARNRNSALVFDDYSVRVPYNSTNAAYIRTQIAAKIRSASVTLCLIGPSTSTSKWVDWEIEKSKDLGNKLVGVKLYSSLTCPVPPALRAAGAPVLDWDVPAIVRAIG
ncbi:TIR domain-containing protein [Aeromicrobium sp. Leaf272]|uniref:TIR domain-containing protein n=1 Tax=Aeromicrobium sp. Leaf272 TaxID=1736317 RepID=UPI0009EC429B